MDLFSQIFAYDETDLATEFWKAHSPFIMSRTRGYGYWLWKPQVVLQALQAMPEGEALVYMDAGCCLNLEGRDRLVELVAMATLHPSQNVGFDLGLVEGDWTKGDLFKHLDYHDYNSGQIMATAFILVNTPDIRALVKQWLSVGCSHSYHFIDDSPSRDMPNRPGFREHRHDQSIWSILRKQHGLLSLPNETWWEPNWVCHKDKPIHARHQLTEK